MVLQGILLASSSRSRPRTSGYSGPSKIPRKYWQVPKSNNRHKLKVPKLVNCIFEAKLTLISTLFFQVILKGLKWLTIWCTFGWCMKWLFFWGTIYKLPVKLTIRGMQFQNRAQSGSNFGMWCSERQSSSYLYEKGSNLLPRVMIIRNWKPQDRILLQERVFYYNLASHTIFLGRKGAMNEV
jgi:hypothetical protein